ncbi:Down syndrome cell adhesion molecule homolog [Schistocerca nitens]|uniref:Down syndrome cell adhesion molecule homolog n=1 Tax=Schistocerca nitens TaxID=7011 RepID=UPI00211910B6|nr:Down syndrome cell adhesion molecule homolog [Schistocerca nitens]
MYIVVGPDVAPVLVATFAGGTLRPGAAWSAQCEAAGSPLPTLSWQRDGAPLSSDEQRLQVTMQAGSASAKSRLSVSGARPEDGGLYECVASNAVGTARHSAPLRVLGPPRVRPMQDRRVVDRADAVFHCRVTGYPISEIRWEREGRSLPENHRQQIFPNGTLIIKDIQKQADEGGYVCIATNPDGHTSRSKLNIQVLEPPEIDPIAVKSDLQEGMRMHLTCVVRKGDFPISIHWLKDGAVISRDQEISAKPYDEYSSILSFSRLAIRHTGNYTCQATNAAAITNYTVEIIVNDPPSWKVEPTDAETVAGKSVILPCAAEGSPTPGIMWKRDTGAIPPLYQELNHLMKNYKMMQNGSLIIYDTHPEDSGYYLCQVSNGIGVGLSKVIYLTVHGKY